MGRGRASAVWVAAAVAATTLAGPVLSAHAAPPGDSDAEPVVSRFDERFRAYTVGRSFSDGSVFGRWRVVFDGTRPGSGVSIWRHHLRLDPEPVIDPNQTRAALVVSRAFFDVTALHIASTWTTLHQNRVSGPNPWEVGWLVWDYVDPAHFTYLALKPNGWEIGRRDPAGPGGQRFVATGESVLTPIGLRRSVTVDRVGTQTTVRVDGMPLATYVLPADEVRGRVGMYTEDALADWQRLYVATS